MTLCRSLRGALEEAGEIFVVSLQGLVQILVRRSCGDLVATLLKDVLLCMKDLWEVLV